MGLYMNIKLKKCNSIEDGKIKLIENILLNYF